MTPEQLFNRVTMAAPGFKVVMEEHLRYYGELLPHVLIADLLRYLGSHFRKTSQVEPSPPTAAELEGVLLLLDAAIEAGNSATENAIAVSFIEGIETEPFFHHLYPLLGAHLRAELERQRAWQPGAR